MSVRSVLSTLWAPVVAAAHIGIFYGRLPDPMASHFGQSGRPDGFMSRAGFCAFYLGLVVSNAFLFEAIGAMIRRLPASAINLPNKEYWLAPERREKTLRRLAGQLRSFGAATSLFLITSMHATFQANIDKSPLGSLFFVCLVAYLIYTTLWTLGLVRAHNRPAKTGP